LARGAFELRKKLKRFGKPGGVALTREMTREIAFLLDAGVAEASAKVAVEKSDYHLGYLQPAPLSGRPTDSYSGRTIVPGPYRECGLSALETGRSRRFEQSCTFGR